MYSKTIAAREDKEDDHHEKYHTSTAVLQERGLSLSLSVFIVLLLCSLCGGPQKGK